jgi:DNA-binding NarL/FixJ family response regulator
MNKFYRIPDSPVIDNGAEITQVNLTQREVEVMLLLWQGLTQNEIASQLKLSRNTIRNHVQNACAKVGVNSTIGVLQWYIDQVLLAEYGRNFIELCIVDGGYNV